MAEIIDSAYEFRIEHGLLIGNLKLRKQTEIVFFSEGYPNEGDIELSIRLCLGRQEKDVNFSPGFPVDKIPRGKAFIDIADLMDDDISFTALDYAIGGLIGSLDIKREGERAIFTLKLSDSQLYEGVIPIDLLEQFLEE